MHAIWGLGLLSLTKCVIVVDEHVDVHDYEQVVFHAGANVDPARDVVLVGGAARPPRPRARAAVRSAARSASTRPRSGPRRVARPWPDEIEMSPEVRALVDRRWAEYGIGSP